MALVQNATILIVIPLDIQCKRHLTAKLLSTLDQKYLKSQHKIFSELLQFLSSFSKIIWLHLTVTPSISLENKHRIDVSNALLVKSRLSEALVWS